LKSRFTDIALVRESHKLKIKKIGKKFKYSIKEEDMALAIFKIKKTV